MADNTYDKIGGEAGCRKLVEAFYTRLTDEPALVAVYPKHLRCAIDALGWYVQELLGGPPEHSNHTPYASLRESHSRFRIGMAQRDAWMRNMKLALAETTLDESTRHELAQFFEIATSYLVNAPGSAKQSNELSVVARSPGDYPGSLWEIPSQMEAVAAAARSVDPATVSALLNAAQFRSHLAGNRSAHARILAMLGDADEVRLLAIVEAELDETPELIHARYGRGYALLHGASQAGAVRFATLLVRRGARADIADAGGHCPLYHVGNATVDCAAMVPMFVAAGADVNDNGGLMRTTALHMAARRGNEAVAAALLDAGADIEARDSRGVTPLGRAVSCRKRGVADILIAHGAKAPNE